MKKNTCYLIMVVVAAVAIVRFSTGCSKGPQTSSEGDCFQARLDSVCQVQKQELDTVHFNHPQLGELILPRIPFRPLTEMTGAELLRITYFDEHYHLYDTIVARCERLHYFGYKFPTDYLTPHGNRELLEISARMDTVSTDTQQGIKLYQHLIDERARIIRENCVRTELLDFMGGELTPEEAELYMKNFYIQE